MFNEKKVSRKDFLKCLLGAMCSFLFIVKFPSINFAKNIEKDEDGNNIAY